MTGLLLAAMNLRSAQTTAVVPSFVPGNASMFFSGNAEDNTCSLHVYSINVRPTENPHFGEEFHAICYRPGWDAPLL